MNRFRQAGVIFLVILVLISTTGFTVYHHICACKPVPVAVQHHSCCEPVKQTSSCCENEAPRPIPVNDACSTGCSHDHKGCKDVPLYFKASIVAVPAVQKVLLPEVLPALVTELPYGMIAEILAEETLDVWHPESPPPRAGRTLVNYLHQIKIPFNS